MARWMAAFYDWALRRTERAGLRAWRGELLQGLSGDVLEVGAGTGLNLSHYPPGLPRLVLSEPDPHMRARLAERAPGAELSPAALEQLPWPDASFDWVVATLVLCSVKDPASAVREVRRVLKPGGRFAFLEHVAAEPGSRLGAWQARLERPWRWLAGDCHLTRRSLETILAAGLELERVERADLPAAPAWVRPTVRGIARKPVD